jgi:hypothetical protein
MTCRKFVHLRSSGEKKIMKNEILEELWKIKDEVSELHDNDIDILVKNLVEKEKGEKAVVDFSHIAKDAA